MKEAEAQQEAVKARVQLSDFVLDTFELVMLVSSG